MFLKLKVSCTCHCDYYISERIVQTRLCARIAERNILILIK